MAKRTFPLTLMAVFGCALFAAGCDSGTWNPTWNHCPQGGYCCRMLNLDTFDVRVFCVDEPNECQPSTLESASIIPDGLTEYPGCRSQSVELRMERSQLADGFRVSDGVAITTSRASFILVVSGSNEPVSWAQRQVRATFSNEPLDCRLECSGYSEFCIDGALPDGITRSVLQLYSRLNSLGAEDGRLQSVEVLQIFNQRSDPCNRGHTVLSNGRLVNEGDECVATVPIPEWNTAVALAFPARIAGSWVNAGGDVAAVFEDASTAAELRINDEGLNEEWGGLIRSVRATSSRVHLETENGCMMVGLAG